MANDDAFVEIDPDDYPDEIECEECGGTASKIGGNWGGYRCEDCGLEYPFEAAE